MCWGAGHELDPFDPRFGSCAIVLDLVLMVISFRKRTDTGRALGYTLCAAFCCTVTYFCSVFVETRWLYELLQGLYFSCVTVALLCILRFMMLFINLRKPFYERIWYVLVTAGILDVLTESTNVLHHAAITYTPVERVLHYFTYAPLTPFRLHLIFCYVLVGLLACLLLQKVVSVPAGYRSKYGLALGILLGVVALNAVYLYFPTPGGSDFLDYSLLGYSVAALAFYWLAFRYSTGSMTKVYQGWMYNSLRQGVLLFDYEGRLLMSNDAVRTMMPTVSLREGSPMGIFLVDSGLNKKLTVPLTDTAVQFYQPKGGISVPMRCETHVLNNRHGRLVGQLFIISPVVQDTDLLTGFMTWEYFRFLHPGSTRPIPADGVCVMCDINGLGEINENHGRAAGDQALQYLANELRTAFTEDTAFIRCREANLALVCGPLTEAVAQERLRAIKARLAALPEERRFSIQSTVLALSEGSAAPEAIERCTRIIRIKKLMDRSASHSDLLNSIIQILQECDSDTEAHVQRTQQMCMVLGRRLGLGEDDLSHLSLLAILHDIGKIGVPLDILNKPGKLSPTEWNVIKSHVEKGARIAASSADLKDISYMILCHHERWDGKGYPAGLSKESIPLLSRIISVVDSYDAMVYNRSYRRAMSPEAARNELRRCAGTQFDPTIVTAMLQLLEESEEAPHTGEAAAASENGYVPGFRDAEWSRRDAEETASGNVYPMVYTRYIINQQGQVISADEDFERLTGYSQDDVRDMKLTQQDLLPVEDWEEYGSNVIACQKASSGSAYLEHRILKKDGSVIRVACLGRAYYDSAARATFTEIFVTDIIECHAMSQLLEAEHTRAMGKLEAWESKFRTDSLTGLLNHEAFCGDAQELMLSGDRQAVLLMLDLDHFKSYNDTFGHRMGDEFLILCAQNLAGLLEEGERASRMGGDEFAALLLFAKDAPEAEISGRCAHICRQLNLLLSAHSRGVSGVSCGAAVCGPDTRGFDRLYEAADKALYRAKEAGRGRFVLAEK